MFIRPSDIKCFFVCLNFVLFEIIPTGEVYSEPSRTSKMELFTKKFNGFFLLTIFAKNSILDVRLGFEYSSDWILNNVLF